MTNCDPITEAMLPLFPFLRLKNSGELPESVPDNQVTDPSEQKEAQRSCSVQVCDSATDFDINFLETADDVAEALRDLTSRDAVALDVETTGLDPRKDRLRLVQIARPGRVYVLDAFRSDVRLLAPLFSEKRLVVAGHNLKFDLAFLRAAGVDAPGNVRLMDTMLASKLLSAGLKESGAKGYHSLKNVLERHLNQQIDKTLQTSVWSGELTDEQIKYAATDAHIVLELRKKLREDLIAYRLQEAAKIEMQALPAVLWMEERGVLIDKNEWRNLAESLARQTDELEATLNEKAGKNINWRSSSQVLSLLRSRGHHIKNTKDETLKALAESDDIVKTLLEFRKVSKRSDSFGLAFLDFVGPDGRIHPSFDQAGAATGRMTCRDPNLQQIPREPEFRRCFVAPDGRALIKADYSQIELRIVAEIAQDQKMIRAYSEGKDLHTLTAHLVLGKPLADVTKHDRQSAKALNFGLVYGMGAERFKEYAEIDYGRHWTLEEAMQFKDKFFETYNGIRRWHRNQPRGETETRTLSGRRRLAVTKFTEKTNTPVQGTGADGIKAALGLLWQTRETCPSAFPILAVHDEIVVECARDEVDAAKTWLEDCMVRGMERFLRAVPVVVESTECKDWSGTPLEE